MDYGKEFEKYATKHHGISSTNYTKITSSLTPYIMEERQMNITQMDVFSRLMMDRIIFLGTGINDQVANIIQPDVATICTGMAASMGAVLMCAGEKGKRSALPHSRIMIHQPLGGAQGQASDIEITAREIMKLKGELYEIIANHSGQSIEKVHDDSDRDYWMKADEAKAYGMIDEVLARKK